MKRRKIYLAVFAYLIAIILTGCSTMKGMETEGAKTIPDSRISMDVETFSPTQDEEARKLYNQGVIYFKENNLEKAKESYLKALELDDRYTDAMDNLGLIYRIQGDYEKAIYYYKKSIEILPDNYVAHQNLAVVYSFQGNFDESIKEYQKIIEIDQNNPEGHYGLGRMYVVIENYGEALPELSKAEDIYRKAGSEYVIDAQFLLGLSHYGMKNYDESLEYFLGVYSFFEDDPSLNYYLGISYLLKTEPDEKSALTYLKKAEKLGYKIPAELKESLGF